VKLKLTKLGRELFGEDRQGRPKIKCGPRRRAKRGQKRQRKARSRMAGASRRINRRSSR
jgi:hypothetical protein